MSFIPATLLKLKFEQAFFPDTINFSQGPLLLHFAFRFVKTKKNSSYHNTLLYLCCPIPADYTSKFLRYVSFKDFLIPFEEIYDEIQ